MNKDMAIYTVTASRDAQSAHDRYASRFVTLYDAQEYRRGAEALDEIPYFVHEVHYQITRVIARSAR